MSELNTQIKEAIDSFDMARARELLRDALKEADAETYYLASKVALDDDQKREFLEKAIALDLFHEKAHNELKNHNSRPSEPEVVRHAHSAPPPEYARKEKEGIANLFLEKKYTIIAHEPKPEVVSMLGSESWWGKLDDGLSSYIVVWLYGWKFLETILTKGGDSGYYFGNDEEKAKTMLAKLEALGENVELIEFKGPKNLTTVIPPDDSSTDGLDLFLRFNAVGFYILGGLAIVPAVGALCNFSFGTFLLWMVALSVCMWLGRIMFVTLNKRAIRKGYFQSIRE